ncbi:hypothetical protein Tco_1277972, partial [Tanacetum coccineum]
AWEWSRPGNIGRSKAELNALILDIANLEMDEVVDSDSCIWSLSHDNIFSVNSARKHIDDHTLPSLSLSTRWCKVIPKKILLCGVVFTLGLVLRSHSFPPVTIGTSGCSLVMLQTSRRIVLIQSSQLLLKFKVIMEYLVKISKKARILELKQRHLKITVLTSYTPYPSRKIRRICACTPPKTTREQDPIRRIQRSLYAVFKLWK